jgi:hypothetical protein
MFGRFFNRQNHVRQFLNFRTNYEFLISTFITKVKKKVTLSAN